ncbi:MAG TPA: ATP-binding protein [Anaerolineae bacterium]|nr:ATP-binding protein [Anaerolineae bacterium]HOR00094.1 ATP-binding protein [Anaerolineae bacterium]HPL26878.1 ATP-binding protein [Anaerolineae bacterium]
MLWKLTLAFVLVAVTTAALVAVFMRVTSADRLSRLIVDQQRAALTDTLADYYAANGSWAGVARAWPQSRREAPAAGPAVADDGDAATRPLPRRDRPLPFGLADAQGVVIIPADPDTPPGVQAPPGALRDGVPVLADGKQVGTVLVARWAPGLNPEEALFLERTHQALLLAVTVAVLVALCIGLLLARAFIRPLHALSQAAQSIAQGQLEQQVKVGSGDEIGQLAAAFNRMSQEVARVNQLRRQMTADIAHDLRTPLTVIAGYVESMQEGVLEPTAERLSIIYREIGQLQTLVGDLRMLSQADAGELPMHLQPIAPRSLLERAAAAFQHRAEQQQVALVVEAGEGLPAARVDEERMMQVLGNLLSNALRYTPAGGRIVLSARPAGAKVVLTVADNGPGIAAEDLPYIFERSRRADRSRHAESGETGLGLAIVRALVEAHGGAVRAESAPGGGTTIHVCLPAAWQG